MKVLRTVALCTALTVAGCVHRELIIRTKPVDALVEVDGREIGRSPTRMPFTFYGTRRVRLQKEGYATKTVLVKVSPPWYEVFPLDFVSEILLPVRLVDRHEFTFQLEKPKEADEGELLKRAEALRREVRQP